ncbi:BTB/POZ domain-containing adapter for CUL3-mediated RhoA degradation protein 3 [Rhincodon typus]|uniref:BTB/POZ domain-containing adapter for CUL3-mediated RhoA degradation protein 3 n=1 Tax=Rhincodon typus TaxID=259920 RepID=UPI002030EF56|nr:BTB/POZ domain-containing adapter for CUL3-mediated RhoA degradation protein 3 [Rhincodon typus]
MRTALHSNVTDYTTRGYSGIEGSAEQFNEIDIKREAVTHRLRKGGFRGSLIEAGLQFSEVFVLVLQQKETYEPFCKVPVITSNKEEQRLIATSNKPAVKLLYNRSNNKYSYTSNSDDNMLKNIELFDKLSLRFNGRVLFIKDVLGDEICCWSFYGQGRKIAEVCCTSIVYATEKKQTKVEFPEARIYEETLNILLYETQDGRGPDNALLEATGGAAGRSHHLEEEEERDRIERVRRIHIKRPDDRSHLHQ